MRIHVSGFLLLSCLSACALASGCLPFMKGGDSVPTAPAAGSKCRLGSTQAGLLITEWSAAEKANLEAMLKQGAVPVAFSGCSMKVISQCRLGGSYAWQRTTVTSDGIDIQSEADLYAKFPLGVAALKFVCAIYPSLQLCQQSLS